ncbi:MAG: hypothetical protein GY754_18065 [bacterium]|nr:hypothetical protein [bacterium]
MKTANIKFDDKTFKFLEKESEIMQKSISEIVNDSIKESMTLHKNKILAGLDNIFGISQDNNFNVNNYIDEMRQDRKL